MRLALAAAAVVVVALAAAAPATAHVTVSPTRARAGENVAVVFTAPNERTAPVVALRVVVPDGFHVTKVREPAPWQGSRHGRVVEWSGGLIAPGSEQRFPIVGRMSGDDATFHAAERFSDGDVEEYTPRVKVVGGSSAPSRTLFVLVAAGGAAIVAAGIALALWLRRASSLQDS